MVEGSREDIIVSLRLASLLERLNSPLLREFGFVWGVEDELAELCDALESIQIMLDFAENAQRRNHVVKRWLKKLRNMAYDLDNELDEFIYEAIREKNQAGQSRRKRKETDYFSFDFNQNQILHQHEIAPRLNKFQKKIYEIRDRIEPYSLKGSEIKLQYHLTEEPRTSSLMDQSLILSRNEDLDAVKTQLLSNTHQTNNRKNAPVVAIVGMSGIGKTTLAQLLYNDPDVKDYFPTRAWVCVSNDFNVERLSKEILESTSGSACKLENLDQIQRKLEERLGGNRFLLVLDDVWSEKSRYWEALRVPFRIAEKGSRIIVTTRSRKTVSSIRDTIYAHDLQILSNESCWELIKRRAFAEETMLSVEPGLEAIGREVAKKCKGLPLAASTIGSLLYSSKPDVEEWENILQSDMWNSEDDELPASLSLSYHYLPPHLKQCFAYCSLFPKDHEFDKKTSGSNVECRRLCSTC